jgi:hypothetical protein
MAECELMTELPKKTRGLARWPWRTVVWTIAVAVAIDCASLVVEHFKPRLPESGPNLVNWNGPRLTPAEELGTEVRFFLVINLALLATVLGTKHLIGKFRRGELGLGAAVLALILLPLALIGVGGTLVLFLSMFR